MAKLPTYEEMGKKIAEEALDGYIYKGKTLREWVDILAQTKSEYEHDHEVVKAYHDGQAFILDKIRAKTERMAKDEPSVQPKTGHWIIHDNHRECSKCKVWLPKDMPRNSYCPNCGCKMSEIPTGSEICDNDCEHCDWVTCPKEEGEV